MKEEDFVQLKYAHPLRFWYEATFRRIQLFHVLLTFPRFSIRISLSPLFRFFISVFNQQSARYIYNFLVVIHSLCSKKKKTKAAAQLKKQGRKQEKLFLFTPFPFHHLIGRAIIMEGKSKRLFKQQELRCAASAMRSVRRNESRERLESSSFLLFIFLSIYPRKFCKNRGPRQHFFQQPQHRQ